MSMKEIEMDKLENFIRERYPYHKKLRKNETVVDNVIRLLSEKFAQCRYCTNSSNEGSGVWLPQNRFNPDGKSLWICRPCFEKIKELQ